MAKYIPTSWLWDMGDDFRIDLNIMCFDPFCKREVIYESTLWSLNRQWQFGTIFCARKSHLKLAFKRQLSAQRVWTGSQQTWIPAGSRHSPAAQPRASYLSPLHLCVLFTTGVLDYMS